MTKVDADVTTDVFGDAKFKWSIKVNGITVGSADHTGSCITTASQTISNQPNNAVKLEITYTITDTCTASSITLISRIKTDGGSVLAFDNHVVSSTGTFKRTVLWKWKDGTPNGSPTYLEELHKLDRTSSSQYIPSIL